jgi:beta-lactamase regulating signal transducer with metallopeptidase domain
MGVTVYSVIVSVVFYNLSLIVVFLLRRSGAIRAKYTSALLLFLTLLGAIRLLTPIDLDDAYVIRSYKILPAIEDALTAPLPGGLSPGEIILLIWAAGTLVFILRDLRRQMRYDAADRLLSLTENEQISRIAAEFGEDFTLKISPEITLPYVTGLLKPVICVPDLALSDEEWRNIFRHETQHIRSLDEWKKLFFRAIRALFWWNPLAHLSENDISLLIELQCDDRVAGSENPDVQESYLRTMMELMKRQVNGKEPVGASRMIGKQQEMKIRFEALLARETKRSKRMRVVLPVVMVAMFVVSYLVIIQPARFPGEEEILAYHDDIWVKDISPVIEEEGDKYILYEDGEYRLYIDGEYAFRLNEELLEDSQFNTIPIYGE